MEYRSIPMELVPIEEWQATATRLKIDLATIMQELQNEKYEIENNKELSEEEKDDLIHDIFIEQGKLSVWLRNLLFFHRNEKEEQFNKDWNHNIDLLNKTRKELNGK